MPTTTEYTYDKNGNMVQDANKNISVSYNILNLPLKIATTGGAYGGIENVYTATGQKVGKIVTDPGNTVTSATKHYIGNMVYDKNIALLYITMEEGRIKKLSSGAYVYEYSIKDHLGNARAVFDGGPGTFTLVQRDDYYPFGSLFDRVAVSNDNKYLYNGKELQDDLFGGRALGWYDYGARFYDPQIGRWSSIDPLAESYYSHSPYHYALNNPIRYTDVFGMGAGDFYDMNGKWIGTDAIDDGRKYIVTDNSDAKCVNNNTKQGMATSVEEAGSAVPVPSGDVMYSANQAVELTDATGNEHGFVATTDGETSSVVTKGSSEEVNLGPAVEEVQKQGKTISFDVHTHSDNYTINSDGTYTADAPIPSGTPGQKGKDYGGRAIAEANGRGSDPSWVIGTQTNITQTKNQIGGKTTTSVTKEKVVTFYTSQRIVGSVNWDKFQKAVSKIK